MSDTTSPRIYDFFHEQHDSFDMMENCQYCQANSNSMTKEEKIAEIANVGQNLLDLMTGTPIAQVYPEPDDLVAIKYPEGIPPGIQVSLLTGEISGTPTIPDDQTEVKTYPFNLLFKKGDNSVYTVPVIFKVHPIGDTDIHLDTPEGEMIMEGLLRELIKNSNHMYAGNGLANKASTDGLLYALEAALYAFDLWGFGIPGKVLRGGVAIGKLSVRGAGGMHALAVNPVKYAKLAGVHTGAFLSRATLSTINKRFNDLLKKYAWYRIWELHRLTTLVKSNILPKHAGRLNLKRVPADKSKPLEYFMLRHGRMTGNGIPAYQSIKSGWFFKIEGISDSMIDDIVEHLALKSAKREPTLYEILKFAMVNPEARAIGKGPGVFGKESTIWKQTPLTISFKKGAADAKTKELAEEMDRVVANLKKQVDNTENWTVKTTGGKTTRIRLGGETNRPYVNLEHFKLEAAISAADAGRALRLLDEWLHSCGAKFTDRITDTDLARNLAISKNGVTGISATGKVLREPIESADEAGEWAFKGKWSGTSFGKWLSSLADDARTGTYIIYTFGVDFFSFSFLTSRKTLESNLIKKYGKMRDLIDDAGGVKNADEFSTMFPELSMLDSAGRLQMRAEAIRRLDTIDNLVTNATLKPIIARSAESFGKTLDETLPHIELKYADLDGTGEATYYIVRSGRAFAKDVDGAVIDDYYKLSKIDIAVLEASVPSLPNRAVSTIANAQDDMIHKFACICDQQLHGVYGYGNVTGKIATARGSREAGKYANGQNLLDTASDSLMETVGGGRIPFGTAANRESARAILNVMAPAYKELDELVLGIAKHNLDDIVAKMDVSWVGARVHQAWCKTVLKRRIIRQFGASQDDQVKAISMSLDPKNPEHIHIIQWVKANVPPGGPIQVLDPVTNQMVTVGRRSLDGYSTLPSKVLSDTKFQSLIREASATNPRQTGGRTFDALFTPGKPIDDTALSNQLHARIVALTKTLEDGKPGGLYPDGDTHLANDVIAYIRAERGGSRFSGATVQSVADIMRTGVVKRRLGPNGPADNFITVHINTGAGPNVNYVPAGFLANTGGTRAMVWEVQNARRTVGGPETAKWTDDSGDALGFFDGPNGQWTHVSEESRLTHHLKMEEFYCSHFGPDYVIKLTKPHHRDGWPDQVFRMVSPEADRILIRPGTKLVRNEEGKSMGYTVPIGPDDVLHGRGGVNGKESQTFHQYLQDGFMVAKANKKQADENLKFIKNNRLAEDYEKALKAPEYVKVKEAYHLSKEKLARYEKEALEAGERGAVEEIVGCVKLGDEVDGFFTKKLQRMDEVGVESQKIVRKFETHLGRSKSTSSKLVDGDEAKLLKDSQGNYVISDTAIHVEVEATLKNGEKIKYLMYQSAGEGTGAGSKGHWYPTPGYDANMHWMVKTGRYELDEVSGELVQLTPKTKTILSYYGEELAGKINPGWCYGVESVQEMAEYMTKHVDDIFPATKLADDFDPTAQFLANGWNAHGVLKPASSLKDQEAKAVQDFLTAVKGRTMSAGDTNSAGIVEAFNALPKDLADIDRAAVIAIQRLGAHLKLAKLGKAGDDVVETPGVATLRETLIHVGPEDGMKLPVGSGLHSSTGAGKQADDFAELMKHLDEGDAQLLKWAQQVDELHHQSNAPAIAELLMKKYAIKKSRSLKNNGSPPAGNKIGVHTERGPGAFNKAWHRTSKSVLRMGAHARNAFGSDAAVGALCGIAAGISTKGTWQTMKEMKENLTSEDVSNMVSTNWMAIAPGQGKIGKVNQIFLRYEKDDFVFDWAADMMDNSRLNTGFSVDGYFDWGACGKIDVCMTRKIEGWAGRTTPENPAADGTGFPSGGHPVLMSFRVDEEHIVTGFEILPGVSPNPLQEYLDSLHPSENKIGCHSIVQAEKYWEEGPNHQQRRNSWIQYCRDGDTFANMSLGEKWESDENGNPKDLGSRDGMGMVIKDPSEGELKYSGHANGEYYYIPAEYSLTEGVQEHPQIVWWYYIDAKGNKQWMKSTELPAGYGAWSL